MNEVNFDVAKAKSNKTKALLYSIILYTVLLAMLYFFKLIYIAPSEPEGVELNYGVDLVGTGNIQTLNHANDSKNAYDVNPSESKTPPRKVEEPKPKVEKVVPKVEKTKVVEKKVITSEADKHKVVVKENPKTSTKVVTKPTPPSPVTKPTNTKPSTNTSTPTTTPTPQRSVDSKSIFNPNASKTGSNGTVGNRDGVGGNNNGDGKKGEVGDKGDPRGTIDGKSLYGNPGKPNGTSSGASVSISGWKQKGLALPRDNSKETGKIVFKVTVDDQGDVVGISTLESTVSPSVVAFYKSYLQSKLSSSLVPDGNPPPRASGTITIKITSGN